MINSKSLLNPNYLCRIKAAVARAVVKANRRECLHGIGHAEVYNRNGALSLDVVARRGGSFEVFARDRNVTDDVKAALRALHADRFARIPVALLLSAAESYSLSESLTA